MDQPPSGPFNLRTLCPKVQDRAFHFISHLPAGRGLSGKELHPGQVAHKGHDLFPGLVRLFAVGFNREMIN